MHAQDFVALYFDWLREAFHALMGRPDRIASTKSIVSDYIASEDQRKRESDPRVVLSFLGAIASTDPELAAAIQAGFFQWLLEKKVLKPIDPRAAQRRGKVSEAKAPRRRPSVERSRGELLPESWLNHLAQHLAGFKRLSVQDRHDVAYLIWMAGTWRRKHALLPDHMTIHHRELYARFGLRGFARINAKLGVFEVTPNWWWEKNATKAYRLKPEVAKIKADYLHKGSRCMTSLIQNDGKRMRTIPEAIAAKDLKGRTQTVWSNANVVKRIEVDLQGLLLLYDRIENLHDDLKAGRGTGSIEDVRWLHDTLAQFLQLCETDVAGIGYVPIRYVVGSTGRLFAQGVSLQTLPRTVRKIALHGLWDYDIENCHYAIFHQLAAQYRFESVAVADYLRHKKATRDGIADRVGITVPQVKVCLSAIMYGAKATSWDAAAIPETIGAEAAQRLYADPVFTALLCDIREGRKIILAKHAKQRLMLRNAVGLRIRLSASPADHLAHLIQGIEAQALRAVQAEYPEDILLLMHDGWVSRKPLDVARMVQVMREATGYEFELAEERITVPPDLDLTNLI